MFGLTLNALIIALGCAPAPPPGEHVDIAGEHALIVWDAATKTEHFIRRADFRTESKAFGFLVPTPTRPTLAEVPDAVFERLARAIEPELVEGTRWDFRWSLFTLFTLGSQLKSAAPKVEVLHRQRVAGYDAVILSAKDAGALANWLRSRGFASRPALEAWLQPYVDQGWILTAFKVAQTPSPQDETGFGTSAVRMSFTAERPFYPYREPADQRDPQRVGLDRSLAVWLVAAGSWQGALPTGPWPAELLYRAPVQDLSTLLGDAVDFRPTDGWLHAWIDHSSPRPGTDDLFFSSTKAPEYRPTYVSYDTQMVPIPLDLIAVLGLCVFGVRRWRRRSNG